MFPCRDSRSFEAFGCLGFGRFGFFFLVFDDEIYRFRGLAVKDVGSEPTDDVHRKALQTLSPILKLAPD